MAHQPAHDIDPAPPGAAGKQRVGPFDVCLDVHFDQHSYSIHGNTTARFLLEVELCAVLHERIQAREGRLVLEFKDDIDLGDVWEFRPAEVYLGPIARRRNTYSLGKIEMRRRYSLAFEIRLPPTKTTRTFIADVVCAWQHEQGVSQCRGTVYAGRALGFDAVITDSQMRVLRAFAALAALRDGPPLRQQLDAERALLARARIERRSAASIAALEKSVAMLVSHELQLNFGAESARLALAIVEGWDRDMITALENRIAVLDHQRATESDRFDDDDDPEE